MSGTVAEGLRRFVLGLCLCCCGLQAWADADIRSVRLWPSADYTRITFEAAGQLHAQLFTLEHPDRLVMDLDQASVGAALRAMPAALNPDDPYIQRIRVAMNRPGTVRVVFDLKKPVKATSTSLDPVADYGYRLMLDFYPEGGASGSDDRKNAPLSAGVPAAPREAALPVVLIAVDAGHGGEDPGAHGEQGTKEKNVTLAIARRLAEKIDGEPGLRAVLIRDGDYFIPLQGRTAKARRLHANLFVSIHADAYINSDAQGSSVFALSEKGATSVAARWLAKRENESDLIGGVDINRKETYLAQTLFDLSQTATINDSLKMANDVLQSLGELNPLHRGRVEQAGFAVLKSPDIPSILVETAFITNPHEEHRLNDPDYQDQLASAILRGLKSYLASHPSLVKSKAIQSGLSVPPLAMAP